MDNFSIDSNFDSLKGKKRVNNNEYSKLKNIYDSFKKNTESIDSNDIMQIELEKYHLKNLLRCAEKQGINEDIEWISSRLDELEAKSPKIEQLSSAYYTDTVQSNIQKSDYIDYDKFKNKKQVEIQASRLLQAKIAPEIANKMLQVLNVNGEVNESSVKTIVDLKNTLSSTRKIEKDAINYLDKDKDIVLTDDDIIVMKDNKVERVVARQNKSSYELQNQLNKLLSDKEDAMLFKFAKKYKNKNGFIDRNASRLLINLRKSGISSDKILPLVDYCMTSDGNINIAKLNMINKLKASKVPDSNLNEIIFMTLPFDGDEDANAINIISNFADNKNSDKKDFVNDLSEIISNAKNIDETKVSDIGMSLCSVLCKNNEPVENILLGLSLCKDNMNKFDNDLSGIFWDLAMQNADTEEIFTILSHCKDEEGNVKRSLVDTIRSFLENGEDKDKVKAYLI